MKSILLHLKFDCKLSSYHTMGFVSLSLTDTAITTRPLFKVQIKLSLRHYVPPAHLVISRDTEASCSQNAVNKTGKTKEKWKQKLISVFCLRVYASVDR